MGAAYWDREGHANLSVRFQTVSIQVAGECTAQSHDASFGPLPAADYRMLR